MAAGPQNYMYGDVAKDIEARRLHLLCESHNPHTMEFLSPFISGKKNILEIGCGTGELAKLVAEVKDADAHLLAVDKEAPQVAATAALLADRPHTEVMQLDIIEGLDLVRAKSPFDLIYCRWLICHIPVEQQVKVLHSLFELLSASGVFLMDECDNRAVRFYHKDGVEAPHATAATAYFTEYYGVFAAQNRLNLQLDAVMAIALLNMAGEGLGEAKNVGSYQVHLDTAEKKEMVRLGKESTAQRYTAITGDAAKAALVIGTYKLVEEDPKVVGDFLQEHVTVFTRA